MAHNVLVLSRAALPKDAVARRRLGLPPAAPGEAPVCVRIESVPARLASLVARAVAAAGGDARAAPDPESRGARVLLISGGGRAIGAARAAARRHASGTLLAGEIARAVDSALGPTPALTLRRGRLPLGRRTLVMGILNVTPDSFSDGGRYRGRRAAVAHALRMAAAGADIIDIGGESTRPGSAPVPLEEEARRVLPILAEVASALAPGRPGRPLLSIDTTRSEIVRRAAAAGADLVNDISGLTFDPAMPAAVAEAGLPVVISHIRGRPRTMQRAPRYRNLLPEIAAWLRSRIDLAVRAGVREERILVDPGLGFGKRRRDNLAILAHLSALKSLGRPILIGASRKSFLAMPGGLGVSQRLERSLAAEALAIAGGADIIRVHDVAEAVRVARLCDAVLYGPPRTR